MNCLCPKSIVSFSVRHMAIRASFWKRIPCPRSCELSIFDGISVSKAEEHDFVYGLPELNRKRITGAAVANPGCFATAIQLGLLPLAKNLLLNNPVHITAITGSTGAGQKLTSTSHFSWRNNNMSVYKPFTHQHLPEIRQSLSQLQHSFSTDLNFIPVRGGLCSWGIFVSSIPNVP